MVNYTLKSLTYMIKKCCVSSDNESLNDMYSFSLNITKLKNMLKQKNTNLHLIALNKSLESRAVQLEDLQLITEYVHDNRMYNTIFDGKSHILQFMLFSSENSDGEISFLSENENGEQIPMSEKELFDKCNIDVDDNFVKNICRDLPCYRVIVTRSFVKGYNDKIEGPTDRFEYKVNIRSNFNMVAYQKSQKEDKKEEAMEEPVVEETVEEVVE